MTRGPDGTEARLRRVTFRITAADEDDIDILRGFSSRSEYLRALVATDKKRRRRAVPDKENPE